MIDPSLIPVDLSTEVMEHALAHAEQPSRDCHVCANGSPIRTEDYDLAIKARLYNARQLLVSMIKHLGRQKCPQVSLTALHILISEIVMLQSARDGEIVVTTKEI